MKPLFPLFLEDLERVFLATGSGICVFSCRATVLLEWALLGGQLRDAGAALCPHRPRLPSSCWWRCVRFSGIGAEGTGRFWQAVHLSHAGRLLHAVYVLHEYRAVMDKLCRTDFLNAVPSVGGVRMQWDGIICTTGQPLHERSGLDEVAFGAIGRDTNLGEWQGRVRVGSI